MTSVKASDRHSCRSAILPRVRFYDFRDWLVRQQWRIENPICKAEMLRATIQVTPTSHGRKTVFVYNGHDKTSLMVFDEAADLVNQFKREVDDADSDSQ